MQRLIYTFLFVLSGVASVSAQAWPAPNPRGAEQLDQLITAATLGRAVERVPASDGGSPATYRVSDPAGLHAAFVARRDLLTDEACDACLLRWRDAAPGQKRFWVLVLRGMAQASNRPRTLGLADLLDAATQAGDSDSQARALRLLNSARDRLRAARDLAWEAAAENEMGLYALARDRYDEADARFEKAGDLYARAFHPRHRLVASTLRNRGIGPAKRQDYATAIRYYRRAADLLDPADPDAAAERVAILQNLSSAYFSRGDMTSAIGPIREATDILTRQRGPKDPALLPFLENLGWIYFSRDEFGNALATARRAYDIAQTAFGPEDPRVVRYLRAVSDHSRRSGRVQEALEGHREAVRILEKAAEKDAETLGDLLHSIGDDLRDLHDLAGAVEQYRAAVEHYREQGGRTGKIKAAMTITRVAGVTNELGRVKEAGELYRQAIRDLITAAGPANPLLIICYQSYGLHLLQNGELPQAAAQYRLGHDLAGKLGREIEQADLAQNLAHAYQLAGDQDQALAAVNQALAIYRKFQHPKLATAYSTLASIHLSRGEDAEAVRYHQLAHDMLKKISGPDDPSVIALGNMVAADLYRDGRFAESEQMLRATTESLLHRLGKDHPDYADSLVMLARCQATAGRVGDGDENLDRAIAILRRVDSPRKLVSALFEKAELRTRVKQTDVAIKVCRDALDVIAAAGLSGSELDAQAHARLGGAARAGGDKPLAEGSYRQAVKTLRALKAGRSRLSLHCMKGIALMRGELGDSFGALEWIDQALACLSVVDPAKRTFFLAPTSRSIS